MFKVNITTMNNKEYGGVFDEIEQANAWINNHKRKNTWGLPEREVEYTKYQSQDPRAEVVKKLSNDKVLCKIPCEYEIVIEEVEGSEPAEHVWRTLRVERNQALRDCDKTQLADYPITSSEKKVWRDYRTYLRDLPKHYNNKTIYKYKIMTLNEWKIWKGI